MKLFGIKNCDTMKKAMIWLETHGFEYEFVDYKKAGVVAQALPDWLSQTGWETLLNKRGLTWKKLTDAQRAEVDEAKACLLMQQYPSLIKRPVLVTPTKLLVGFTPADYQEHLT
jgi:arsenate reductase